MKPPKLYRKVWLAVWVFDEDYDCYEYIEARRSLKPDGSWFWLVDSLYNDDIEGENPEWWFEHVIYKNPDDFDFRNCGTYNRPRIKNEEITTVNPETGDFDFDADIPF